MNYPEIKAKYLKYIAEYIERTINIPELDVLQTFQCTIEQEWHPVKHELESILLNSSDEIKLAYYKDFKNTFSPFIERYRGFYDDEERQRIDLCYRDYKPTKNQYNNSTIGYSKEYNPFIALSRLCDEMEIIFKQLNPTEGMKWYRKTWYFLKHDTGYGNLKWIIGVIAGFLTGYITYLLTHKCP